MNEILPCPFCGGAANMHDSWGGKEHVCTHKIGCEGTSCLGSFINLWHATPEDAIAAWNTRASQPSEGLAEYFECVATQMANTEAGKDSEDAFMDRMDALWDRLSENDRNRTRLFAKTLNQLASNRIRLAAAPPDSEDGKK